MKWPNPLEAATKGEMAHTSVEVASRIILGNMKKLKGHLLEAKFWIYQRKDKGSEQGLGTHCMCARQPQVNQKPAM